MSRVLTKHMSNNVMRRSFSTVPAAAYLPTAQVTERVINIVKTIRSAPRTVEVSHHFVADMGFDSLIRKELATKLEEEFCVALAAKDADSLLSVKAAVDYFSAHPKAR